MADILIDKLRSLAPLGEELAERIRMMARTEEYKAGDIILREGQVCRRASLIVKGLTRSYYLNDGVEITSRFMEEGSILTSWPSYFLQQPGYEYIEAVEDTILTGLNHDDIEQLYKEFPVFNVTGRKQTEFAFYQAEMRTQLLRKHTAEEKYRYFTEHHPTLLQRVALKHIATYLGMSEETLSRVRSRFHKK
ncbi:MAG: Crp/Fnr family transcriptional regulator [Chitinophagaceae bacterium]|nr:Crp/Fnr family transcriptional regulator [Chitinophagaceae bacterium]